MLDLCGTYRPKTLKEVYGQDMLVSFLRAVVKHPDDSPRYYLFSGKSGTGKTTTARAFAHDLIGDSFMSSPNYIEIDSSERYISDNFDRLRDLIFSEVSGYKIVLLDECHLLKSEASQKLLKILEDFAGNIFIIFGTTNPELMFSPLVSRLIPFNLTVPTQEQCVLYAKSILEKESTARAEKGAAGNALAPVRVSDKALRVAAMNAMGNLRTMLKQCEIILFQGEEAYLKTYSSIWKSIEEYFFNAGVSDTDVITSMYKYPPVQLRSFITVFLRDEIINPSSKNYDVYYSKDIIVKLFSSYLKLISYVNNSDDYFSFLYVFRNLLMKVHKGKR